MGEIGVYYKLVTYFIYNIFGIYVIFRFNKIFFYRENVSKKIEFLAYSVYFFGTSIVYLLWNIPILTVVTNITLCFIVNSIYNSNLIKCFSMSILINAIFFLSESVSYLFVIKANLRDMIYVLSFISTLFTLVIVLILENIIMSKKEEKLALVHWATIFIVPAISIYLAYLLVMSSSKIVQTSLGVIGLLTINFLIFYLYDVIIQTYGIKYERVLLHQRNKAYLNELDLIKTSNENFRRLKHDLKNHILVLESMVDNNELEKIQNYLRNMQNEFYVKGNYVSTQNLSLDSIVNYKLQKAEELGADIKVDINYPENLDIEEFDITIILGNLLDNAIDSIKECQNKFIELNINVERGLLFINIKNSTIKVNNSKDLKLWKTNKCNSENHGFGLKQIKKIIDKNNGKFDISINNKVCESNIMLYIK